MNMDYSDDNESITDSQSNFFEKCATVRSIEGESIDDLDIDGEPLSPDDELNDELNIPIKTNSSSLENYRISEPLEKFPKFPCFAEFDEHDILEYHGSLDQLQTILGPRRHRYAVLFRDKLVVFKKPEQKVSKFLIPLNQIININKVELNSSSGKSDALRFRLETLVKHYKFQCHSIEETNTWCNLISKLRESLKPAKPDYLLVENVTLLDVKKHRVFAVDKSFAVTYFESNEFFESNIAMHRIKLKSSGVKRDMNNPCLLHLRTAYRLYDLQFESSQKCDQWFKELTDMIHKAISNTILFSNAKPMRQVEQELYVNESNMHCAECGNEPQWTSISLFITLCKNCSGIHRSLSPNISRVQSFDLDERTWTDKNIIKLFQVIGNGNANAFWAQNMSVPLVVDQKLLHDKYVKKKFIEDVGNIVKKTINLDIIEAAGKGDVLRVMKLFHLGADLTFKDPESLLTVMEAAQKNNHELVLKFFDCQSKFVTNDWRKKLFQNLDFDKSNFPDISRQFTIKINRETKRNIELTIKNLIIKIREKSTNSVFFINFQDICLICKKDENLETYLLLTVKDTDMTFCDETVNVCTVEIAKEGYDQANDISDLKNILTQCICPKFIPKNSFDCASWVVVSTIELEWRPYLLVLQSNRILLFYSPTESTENCSFELDIRKIQRIDELKDNNYSGTCSFAVYNFASICLNSSVIYHLRSETKYGHEELLNVLRSSWEIRGLNLTNQILTQGNVPLAVHKMIDYLQVTATTLDGPFRIVGRVSESNKIYKKLVTDPNSFVFKDVNPRDVTSALKNFFGDLSDPLLTKKLYKSWISAAKINDFEKKLSKYKKLLSELPIVNYATLRKLIFLLVNIVDNTAFTQMTPQTLSTSFSSCFLVSRNEDHGFNNLDLQILQFLIENYRNLFDVTQEEIDRERTIIEAIIKGNSIKVETSLLRQIHFSPTIDKYLIKELKLDKDETTANSSYMSYKQIPIRSNWKTKDLKAAFFYEEHFEDIMLFEEKKIDDFLMQCLIYPPQNIVSVIEESEKTDSRPKQSNSSKKLIFKVNSMQVRLTISKADNSFSCLAYSSSTNRDKMFVEITVTNQLNIWKNESQGELIRNFSIKSLILYRSCSESKTMVAIDDLKSHEDKKAGGSNMAKLMHFLPIKNRSLYNFYTFLNRSDYEKFLHYFDQAKLFELTPNSEIPGMPKRV